MMTQQLRAGILTAPLAAIDRRTLSQAWYSALGFARSRPVAVAPHRAPAISSRPQGVAGGGCEPGGRRTRTVRPALRLCPAPAAQRDRAAGGAAAERRAPSALARAIERRFSRTPSVPARATFALDGGRVHVILRSCGDQVRLIALCAPGACAAVARALEEARHALAARGLALQVERIEAKR